MVAKTPHIPCNFQKYPIVMSPITNSDPPKVDSLICTGLIIKIYIDSLHMTSKRPSWGTTSKFRIRRSIVYKYKIKSTKFYAHKL